MIEKIKPLFTNKTNKYSKEVTDYLFHSLIPSIAKSSLKGGLTTIIDASFLKSKERSIMFSIAKEMKTKFILVCCECNDSLAESRINKRRLLNIDPSEATVEVRNQQKKYIEHLKKDEASYKVTYSEQTSFNKILKEIEVMLSINND